MLPSIALKFAAKTDIFMKTAFSKLYCVSISFNGLIFNNHNTSFLCTFITTYKLVTL